MPDLSSYKIDVSQALVFLVVFVTMAILVGLGKIPSDKLEYLLLVLVPSPIKKDVQQ